MMVLCYVAPAGVALAAPLVFGTGDKYTNVVKAVLKRYGMRPTTIMASANKSPFPFAFFEFPPTKPFKKTQLKFIHPYYACIGASNIVSRRSSATKSAVVPSAAGSEAS